jgi:hypothetical protein
MTEEQAVPQKRENIAFYRHPESGVVIQARLGESVYRQSRIFSDRSGWTLHLLWQEIHRVHGSVDDKTVLDFISGKSAPP